MRTVATQAVGLAIRGRRREACREASRRGKETAKDPSMRKPQTPAPKAKASCNSRQRPVCPLQTRSHASIKESASAWPEFKLADGASTTTICPPIATTGAESNRITCGPEFAGGSLPTTPPPQAKSAAQQQKEELACAAHKKGRLLKRKAPKAEGLMTAFQVASLVHFLIRKRLPRRRARNLIL